MREAPGESSGMEGSGIRPTFSLVATTGRVTGISKLFRKFSRAHEQTLKSYIELEPTVLWIRKLGILTL